MMKKSVKVIIVSLVVLAVVVGGVTWAALWTGSTKDIVAVADKFRPPASWTLVSEKIEPPRLLCLGDNNCPELARVWHSDSALSSEVLSELLAEAKWDFKVFGDCMVKADMSGNVSLCHASGNTSSYKVYIDYNTVSAGRVSPSLGISVTKGSW